MKPSAAGLLLVFAIASNGILAQEAPRQPTAEEDRQMPAPLIDASTDELLASSLEDVRAAVPESAKKNFESSFILVVGDLLARVSDLPDAVVRETFRAELNGKSAGDIALMAELIAGRLNDEEGQRHDKVTASLPDARVAKRESLACEALLSTSIARAQPTVADALELSVAGVEKLPKRLEAKSTAGTGKIAVQIKEQVLRFITTASLDAGETSAAEFQILKNTPEWLYAVALHEGLNGDTLSSFVLNKELGLAIWTKSRPMFFMVAQPDTQSHYLRCR